MDDKNTERAGYGDDQGTRVGKPASGEADGTHHSGMGNEAAEGIHGARAAERGPDARDTGAKSSVSEAGGTGREQTEDGERAGSEPLVDRERVADSSYGGEGGEPRVPPDRPH